MPENENAITEPWVLEATIAVREYIADAHDIELSAEDGMEIAARIETASEFDFDAEMKDFHLDGGCVPEEISVAPGQFGGKEFVPIDPLCAYGKRSPWSKL